MTPTQDLLSLVIDLVPQEDTALDIYPGRLLHGAFLDFVQQHDPTLSQELHDGSGEKPYTLSTLWGELTRRGNTQWLRVGKACQFRVTTLSEQLSELVRERLCPEQTPEWRVGNAPCALTSATHVEHPWAGVASYGELYQRVLDRIDRPPRQITLEFVSPTTFRQGHGNLPMPLPSLVFRNYLAQWGRHTGLHFDEELGPVIEEQVLMTRYQLRTQMVPFARGRMETGFVGECTYTLKTKNPAHQLILGLLADFAFYCGTGAKTTQGMGQTRRQGNGR